MNHLEDRHVRAALALHLGCEPDAIRSEARLAEDLGLDPLDLVLVVLRLEEIAGSELPLDELEGVATVGQMVHLVRTWYRGRDTDPPSSRPRTASGLRPAAAPKRRFGT